MESAAEPLTSSTTARCLTFASRRQQGLLQENHPPDRPGRAGPRAIGGVTSGRPGFGPFPVTWEVLDGPVVSLTDHSSFASRAGRRQLAARNPDLGGFTVDQAQNLAELSCRSALPIDLKLTSQSQVSATLGRKALESGDVLALLVGLFCCLPAAAACVSSSVVFYRFLGVVASLALLVLRGPLHSP